MFDHIGFVARDLGASKVFYDACLGALGEGRRAVALGDTQLNVPYGRATPSMTA